MQLLPRNEPLLRRSGLRRQSNTQPHPGKAAARFMFEVSMLGSDVVSSSPGCKDFCGPSWRTSSPERCAGLTVKLRPITRGRNILIASPACRRRLPGRPAGIPRAVALGIDQDRADYTVSAASGISAASMKSEATPSIHGGFGRCTSPASRRAFAQITAWPRWKRQRRSSRRVGKPGGRGQSWRRHRDPVERTFQRRRLMSVIEVKRTRHEERRD